MNTCLLICIRLQKKEREGEGRRKRRLHSHSLPDFMSPQGACSISSRKFQLSPFLSSQSHSAPAGYQLLPGLYQPRPKSSIEPKCFAYCSLTPLCLCGWHIPTDSDPLCKALDHCSRAEWQEMQESLLLASAVPRGWVTMTLVYWLLLPILKESLNDSRNLQWGPHTYVFV